MTNNLGGFNRILDDTWRGVVRRRLSLEPSELDITPMIDMTFLLLIFFLVASSPDARARAQLPEARHGVGVGKKACVIFTIAQSGLETTPVYLGEEKTAGNQLPSGPVQQRNRIEQCVREGLSEGKPNVLIRADKWVAHREVARIAAAASQVKGIKLYFAVLEED